MLEKYLWWGRLLWRWQNQLKISRKNSCHSFSRVVLTYTHILTLAGAKQAFLYNTHVNATDWCKCHGWFPINGFEFLVVVFWCSLRWGRSEIRLLKCFMKHISFLATCLSYRHVISYWAVQWLHELEASPPFSGFPWLPNSVHLLCTILWGIKKPDEESSLLPASALSTSWAGGGELEQCAGPNALYTVESWGDGIQLTCCGLWTDGHFLGLLGLYGDWLLRVGYK